MSIKASIRGRGNLVFEATEQHCVDYIIEWAAPSQKTGLLSNVPSETLEALDELDGKARLALESGEEVEIVTGSLIPGYPVPILAVRSLPHRRKLSA